MTPEEAIAIMERHLVLRLSVDRAILEKACRLSLEALKWIKEERELQGILYPGLLPGETEK